MRVFLDANILFSTAKSDGAIRRLLRETLARGHECCADSYVVHEARRNLETKGPEALQALDALLLHVRVTSTVRAAEMPETAWLPENDRPVLAAAIHLQCDALVTGDRTHFSGGYGRAFRGVVIYSPRMLAETLFGN